MRLAKDDYLVITVRMVESLELSGDELIAYAAAFGHSMDDSSVLSNCDSYIALWLQSSKEYALEVLDGLSKKRLVEVLVRHGDDGETHYDCRALL